MAVYQTAQRRALLEFMAKHPERPYTIDELSREMTESGEGAPGKSTIYRQMTQLVSEGCVKRSVRGNSRQFLYQLLGGEHCREHLHMRCISCGALLHMDGGESERILSEVASSSGFQVSRTETVLVGLCGDCSHEEKK